MPIVRYWCSVDDTPIGKTSLSYADAFTGMGLSVRIIATKMSALAQQTEPGKPWSRHRMAFLTPLVGAYINVVCGSPDDWKRLYTVGVKNVLITSERPPVSEKATPLQINLGAHQGGVVKLGSDELAREVALKYDVVIVPDEQISQLWETIGMRAVVVPMDVGQHTIELRSALFS